MTIYDLNLLEEALKNDLQKDFILKLIDQTKKIYIAHNKKTNQLKNIINQFSKIDNDDFDDHIDDEKNIDIFHYSKISILSDIAEYKLREVAEILGVSYKHCSRLFSKYKVPSCRTEKNCEIFLGRTIKNSFIAN